MGRGEGSVCFHLMNEHIHSNSSKTARARVETAVLLVLKLIIKYNLDLDSLIKLIDYFIKYEGI